MNQKLEMLTISRCYSNKKIIDQGDMMEPKKIKKTNNCISSMPVTALINNADTYWLDER